jgi:hypothetical protein
VKLRVFKDSIRFRIRRPDLDRLVSEGEVAHAVRTGPTEEHFLTYRLRKTDGTDPMLEPLPSGLCVHLPGVDVERWAAGPETGLEFRTPWGVRVLVEKDFPCMEPRVGEGNEGTFDRPITESAACKADA